MQAINLNPDAAIATPSIAGRVNTAQSFGSLLASAAASKPTGGGSKAETPRNLASEPGTASANNADAIVLNKAASPQSAKSPKKDASRRSEHTKTPSTSKTSVQAATAKNEVAAIPTAQIPAQAVPSLAVLEFSGVAVSRSPSGTAVEDITESGGPERSLASLRPEQSHPTDASQDDGSAVTAKIDQAEQAGASSFLQEMRPVTASTVNGMPAVTSQTEEQAKTVPAGKPLSGANKESAAAAKFSAEHASRTLSASSSHGQQDSSDAKNSERQSSDKAQSEAAVASKPAQEATAAPIAKAVQAAVHNMPPAIVAKAPTGDASLPQHRESLQTTPAQGLPVSAEIPAMPGTIQTAKLIQAMGQSEMRVGMHSAEFGNISVRTMMGRDGIAAEIAVDHGELGKALSAHLPGVQSRLDSEYGIRARIDVQQSGAASAGDGNGRTRSDDPPASSPTKAQAWKSERSDGATPVEAPIASAPSVSNRVLDIRI